MSELPNRADTTVAISRWVGREPEIAYDLHPDLRIILDAARGWSSGRLVDREAVDYQAAVEEWIRQREAGGDGRPDLIVAAAIGDGDEPVEAVPV